MCIFPKQLAQDMFDSNVSFTKILHIPTLSVGHGVSDDFEEFLSSMDSFNSDIIIKNHPELKDLIESIKKYSGPEWDEEHAQQVSIQCNGLEFLVLLQLSIPRNFNFNEKKQFESCSIGGIYQQIWIFAKDMSHAAEQALHHANEIFTREEVKARKEQGLEV